MGNISDKEITYSFWGHYVKGQGHRQFLRVFFYIPFSYATLCCDNWNTFLQRTSKLGQNVCLGKILVKFGYRSSGVCLSVHPSVHPHFLCAAITGILFYRKLSNFLRILSGQELGQVQIRVNWDLSVCLFVHLSVHPSICPHFLCAAITGILFYRKLSNFLRILSWQELGQVHIRVNWGLSVCLSSHLSMCLSIHPSVHTFFVQ